MNRLFFLGLLFSTTLSAQHINPTIQRLVKESESKENTEQKVNTTESKVKISSNSPQHELDSIYKKEEFTSSHLHPWSDSSIKIGLLLPIEYNSAAGKVFGFLGDKDPQKGDIYRLKETSREALDFYEGLQYALSTHPSTQRLEFFLFDTYNNDSIVQDLLLNDTLRNCDIIIGPTAAAQAKFIAGLCRRNKIVNIQPFVAAKNFTYDNPYLVRLIPTIDAHMQQIYQMVTDTFQDCNIIVYTSRRERDLSAARQLDTLFKSYNAVNTHKLKYSLVNAGDTTIPVAKRSFNYYLSHTQKNVLIMTCYDDVQVNAALRTIKEKDSITVFGMPTWIDGDQIHVEHLNRTMPYFTDHFYADTSLTKVNDFVKAYNEANGQKPSRYSYMGYDAMNYLTLLFDKYGKKIIDGVNRESYDGVGYGFHISPSIKPSKTTGEPIINYYMNTAMHLFQVRDYKVWKVR